MRQFVADGKAYSMLQRSKTDRLVILSRFASFLRQVPGANGA